MTISLGVGSAFNESATNSDQVAVTLNSCTAGRGLIAIINGTFNTLVSQVACSDESNLTLVGAASAYHASSDQTYTFAFLSALSGSGNKTLTVTFAASINYWKSIRVMEVVCSAGSLALSVVNAIKSGSWPVGADTITTDVDGCMVLGYGNTASGTWGDPSGYTNLGGNEGQDGTQRSAYDFDVGAAGAKSFEWDESGTSGNAVFRTVAFKEVSGHPAARRFGGVRFANAGRQNIFKTAVGVLAPERKIFLPSLAFSYGRK